MLNLILYLSKAVIFPNNFSLAELNYPSLAWVIKSLVALHRFKIGIITWIGVSALMAGLYYAFTLQYI